MYSPSNTDRNSVLTKAVLNSSERLGMTLDQMATTLRISSGKLTVNEFGIISDSEQGKLALSLIRISIALEMLNGGDVEMIHHFMHNKNLLTGGIPIEQIQHPQGLFQVLEFVEAMAVKI
ncbi:hypothetical protein [Acinetobacter sp. ANC 5600]|uniref:hypothetical protein n=1 Tax=Acinetobacter sp. ANC 5600 TaxID=1960940 RepID=UPI000993EB07|nr:hypothetical protein [Acinetobacter sp. ANC 5600]OOV79455.1 hypothetical protein B1201_16490 [Acinetobacter sp. ANC 5600]